MQTRSELKATRWTKFKTNHIDERSLSAVQIGGGTDREVNEQLFNLAHVVHWVVHQPTCSCNKLEFATASSNSHMCNPHLNNNIVCGNKNYVECDEIH